MTCIIQQYENGQLVGQVVDDLCTPEINNLSSKGFVVRKLVNVIKARSEKVPRWSIFSANNFFIKSK